MFTKLAVLRVWEGCKLQGSMPVHNRRLFQAPVALGRQLHPPLNGHVFVGFELSPRKVGLLIASLGP